MARARRAKPRRSRALIGLIVVALLAGGVLAALRFWPGSLTAIGPTPDPAGASTSVAAEPSELDPTTAAPSPTRSASARPTPTVKPASEQAVRAMKACQQRVQAADEVLAQAKTGIDHWSTHVGAQRDADKGEISPEKQKSIFKATRLKGSADQKRYAEAQRAYDRVRNASCGKAAGADAKVAAALASCQERARAQGAVMKAAAGAMGDWKSHLAAMQRSREFHVDNAQQVWLDAYRAAPKNLNAYARAVQAFDPPGC